MVSNFHANERYRLRVGKVIDIGRPWVDGSSLQHLLVSLPHPYGPKLEHFTVRGKPVRLLWLLPISKGEADDALSHGVELLEREFERVGIDYLAGDRASVI
jgi:hypothetical protein